MKERERFIKLAALKADPTPNPKLELSRLSEGLRKEVKKLVKEGKGKLSLLPEDVRKRVISEMETPFYDPEFNPNMPTATEHPSVHEDIEFDVPQGRYPELQAVVDVMVPEVLAFIKSRVAPVQSEMPYKAQWVLEELIKALEKEV